ncbi:hypothetical protein WOLCODRAFT_65369 [Wolfiporia cocos MD-104 SS10]|uniref:RNA-dependent RNA polymerase n=1 Tax=Wolfiporia cocos (strain MD-104) TaxID=742152 RepID=A0A2H3JPE2_WOLCO|nr:hypothetical protein WOLCODRAFT_65369 [Wolfiporia cocos MD-104 SS10]
MEIEIVQIPSESNEWDVKRTIADVLHGDDFYNPTDPRDRRVNFKISLNEGPAGMMHNGSGTLMLGERKIGEKFLAWLRRPENNIRIHGRKIRLFPGKNKPQYGIIQTLLKAPYVPPETEEERQQKLRKVDVSLHVDKIQIGVFYRPANALPGSSRAFSNECEISHQDKGAGMMWFEYDHKLIRIQADQITDQIAYNIAITFANIRRLAIGFDFGNPFICFDLLTPPMLEKQRINRELTGDEWKDNRKFRQRLSSLNEAHAAVAPYAHHLRLILHEERDILHFAELCKVVDLQPPFRANVEANSMGFFSRKRLHNVNIWLRKLQWPVAFQIEATLRNGLLTTVDLLQDLYGPINEIHARDPYWAGEVLRSFTEALRLRAPTKSPLECFLETRTKKVHIEPPAPQDGLFPCHHVTFTPTRNILEGPYVTQSNRVIRDYAGFQQHFIRVDFRDEDRLQYRWAREVDGTSLLVDRVGGILKNGFELAGRHFEFLAYSQSALREHAVWFMNPFNHPIRGLVTAQKIRDSLGDFSGVIKQPSKYGARMAQAFTATDPSVSIQRHQWSEMEDMGDKPYIFTDGVGTISTQLGDMIWDALCEQRPYMRERTARMQSYQHTITGYKGMVVIDERLEGIQMRLRPSMNKFKAHEKDEADAKIEIARAFDRPGMTYLNRPLVMVLEDRGVAKQTFINLQEQAKTTIHTSSDSMDNLNQLLRAHSLGGSFHLPFILKALQSIGMGFKYERSVTVLRDPFFDAFIQYAKNHILRALKHDARIRIPDSYLLAGVADEGPTYEHDGLENVFTLKEGTIYGTSGLSLPLDTCVQQPDDPEPTYIQGAVVISRNPVVHPGDIQRVFAIGKPPDNQICFFRNLKNVVVLPSKGGRSMASCLGGGDLDGDLYSVIKYGPLLPTENKDPASYEPGQTRELEDGRESTVEDVCDFVVEYLNSDVLGMLSDRHLIIADQSKFGTSDERCMELAALCSKAVDYPKNGVPVDIHDSPRLLIPYKPDWKQAEDATPRSTDYYESTRALGELFRNITIPEPTPPPPRVNGAGPQTKLIPLSDSISMVLRPHIQNQLGRSQNREQDVDAMAGLFRRYVEELRYISMTHALSDAPDVRLSEEEVVVGAIMAKCSQKRWRTDRMYRMRLHASNLVREIGQSLFHAETDPPLSAELQQGLYRAWCAWEFATTHKEVFGGNSFGLIALGVVLDVLQKLGAISLIAPIKKDTIEDEEEDLAIQLRQDLDVEKQELNFPE